MATRRERRKQQKEDELLIDLQEVQEQAGDFFEENQRLIIGVAVALLVIVGGYLAYRTFVLAPKQAEAVTQISQAEYSFEQDSLISAIDNPGNGFPGFADIVDNYGSTASGNIANLYSGMSYLHLGKYEVAIDYLNDYKAAGKLGPALKNGLLGDAHSELQQYSKALSYYKKAANSLGDDFTAPYYLLKAGMLSEKEGKNKDAVNFYKKIQAKYPNSIQGQGIEKYIERASK